MRRLFYFGYYLRETNKKTLLIFLNFAVRKTQKSKFCLIIEAISDSFRFNISIVDYFYFGFYNKTITEKLNYAGTGYMYEFQLKMNPRATRSILQDKILFLTRYRHLTRRKFASRKQLSEHPEVADKFLMASCGKIVVKGSLGQVGAEVRVLFANQFHNGAALISYMDQNNFDLLEEFVVQHSHLMALSPAGLNTVRIITQLDRNQVVILAARLRITVNSEVDNLAAGNIAAPVDVESGIVSDSAIFSDITKDAVDKHPITNIKISGFQIPFWKEVIHLAKEAALLVPENRSVGWDVAICPEGPLIIEGNHNWCKLLWQLPVRSGLKHELEKFA